MSASDCWEKLLAGQKPGLWFERYLALEDPGMSNSGFLFHPGFRENMRS